MKIYALYDNHLGYFQKPFLAEDDKQVLAALAQTINNGDTTNAIAQAPQDFELYTLGEIDQDAVVKVEQAKIANLNSLIRGSVREGRKNGSSEMAEPTGKSAGHAPGTRTIPDTKQPSTNRPAQGAHRTP